MTARAFLALALLLLAPSSRAKVVGCDPKTEDCSRSQNTPEQKGPPPNVPVCSRAPPGQPCIPDDEFDESGPGDPCETNPGAPGCETEATPEPEPTDTPSPAPGPGGGGRTPAPAPGAPGAPPKRPGRPRPPSGVGGIFGPGLFPGTGGPSAPSGGPPGGGSLGRGNETDKSVKKALDSAAKNVDALTKPLQAVDTVAGPAGGPPVKPVAAAAEPAVAQPIAPAASAPGQVFGTMASDRRSATPGTAAQAAAAPAAASAPPSARAQESARLTREANRAMQAGNLREAIALAGQALGQFPRNLQARNLRAMALERAGDRKGAVIDASEALKLKPDNVSLLNTRAWALNGLGRHEAALEDAKKAAEVEPNDAFAHVNVARAEGGLGRRARMISALRKAAGIDDRFQGLLESGLKLPAAGDTELLFAEFGRSRAEPRAKRFLVLVLLTLAGGLLVGLGLLHVASGGGPAQAWRKSLGEAFGIDARAPGSASETQTRGKFWEYYRLKREIASGGMGIVYEAVDESLNRRVAVKQMRGEIRDDADERKNFVKEARVMAALHHPNIVDIYSIIEDDDELYLVFEFVEGKTLEALIAERGRLAPEEAGWLMRGICAALQHAHDKGVIHRDLKPSNIIVTPGGEPKVTDFGIARLAPSGTRTLKLDTTIVGTPPYMAPEAEDGQATQASDVYSLGVCLYEMLTGTPPFHGPPSVMHATKLGGGLTAPSRLVPSLPKALDAVVANALVPVVSSRTPSAAALYAELARVVSPGAAPTAY